MSLEIDDLRQRAATRSSCPEVSRMVVEVLNLAKVLARSAKAKALLEMYDSEAPARKVEAIRRSVGVLTSSGVSVPKADKYAAEALRTLSFTHGLINEEFVDHVVADLDLAHRRAG